MFIMKYHSTMKLRDVMTFVLVLTLFTNLARHDLGTVSALSDAERRNLSLKRRFLQRMIRLKLTSSTQQAAPSKKLDPSVVGNSYKVHRNVSNDYFEWFLSNYIPDKDSLKAMDASARFNPSDSLSRSKMSALLEHERLHNPDEEANPWHRYHEDHLLRQMEERTSPRENTQFRRHASPPSSSSLGAARKKRKKDGRLRREEKKKKRVKEKKKKKRRKENRRLQELMDSEDLVMHNIDGEDYFDCCPSKLVVVEKKVGKDRKNHAVEIRSSHQYFYERVCLPDIEQNECVFPSRSLRKGTKTRCAQQSSYVQAQVRPYQSAVNVDWHLDYIQVRSGCSCQVSATSKRRRKKAKT